MNLVPEVQPIGSTHTNIGCLLVLHAVQKENRNQTITYNIRHNLMIMPGISNNNSKKLLFKYSRVLTVQICIHFH